MTRKAKPKRKATHGGARANAGGRRAGAGRPKKVLAPAPGLVRAFEIARSDRSIEALADAAYAVTLATADGKCDPRTSDVLQGWARELRQELELLAQDRARTEFTTKARLLTPDEDEVLRKYRESKTPRALAPDEHAPPPMSSPPVATTPPGTPEKP